MHSRLASAALCLCAALLCSPALADGGKFPPNIGKFRVGIQTYTFRGDTFQIAVARISALKVKYVEAYPGQPLSASMPGVTVGPGMSPEARRKMRQILDSRGVILHNFGVVGLPDNEAECRKVFDFAKEMGIQVIVSEPEETAFPLIERLVKEYGIRVAIHNHAKPSHYWDPNVVLASVKGLDARIGASPDTGHWMRSGVKPVEGIRQLKGRMSSVHLKDLKEMNVPETRDWPLGQGIADVPAILKEPRRTSRSASGICASSCGTNGRRPPGEWNQLPVPPVSACG